MPVTLIKTKWSSGGLVFYDSGTGDTICTFTPGATNYLNIATSKLYINGTAVAATAAEIDKLASVTAGTVSASKAVVVDANKRIDTLVIANSGLKLGTAGGTAMTMTAAQINTLVVGVAAGYKIARGESAATASVVAATGLTSIVAAVAVGKGSTGTAINNCSAITQTWAAANLTLYRWKHTSAGTATMIASTAAGTISWIAVGT